jgi:hypothetical protein
MRLSAFLLSVVVLIGCSARPHEAWQPERAEAVAWWIEDVAHGSPRLPGEVDPVDAGPRDAVIARWAAGSDLSGRWQPPRQLAMRRARWPALAQALAEGDVLPAGGDGLLAPAPAVEPVRRAEVAALVDAENNDRRFLDGLVLGMGAPDPEVERIYRDAVRSARRKHDAPPAARTAPSEPTAR